MEYLLIKIVINSHSFLRSQPSKKSCCKL